MLQIIGALVALGLLIAVHEGGHFLAARWLGVYVEKFSIGFGPKLISFRDRMTEYRLSIIPLGGYVKMKGENPDEHTEDEKGSFWSLSWWKRALIAFSGPLTNLLFALLILIITFGMGKTYEDHRAIIGRIVIPQESSISRDFDYLQSGDRIVSINDRFLRSWSDGYSALKEGFNTIVIERAGKEHQFTEEFQLKDWFEQVMPQTTTVIGEVSPGLPAYNAGLQEGDRVVAINGNPVSDWYELRSEVQSTSGNTVKVEIERSGGRFSRDIKLQENLMDGSSVIGITQKLPLKVKENYSLWESLKYGTLTTADYVVMNYVGLYKLIVNPSELKNNIGGPVLMYTMSKQTAKQGWNSILSFVAMISIILMVMNLLPIPVLDGGMIFFCLIEGIRRKALSVRTQITLQKIGASVLILLMFFAFSNDFSRLFKRSASLSSQKVELQQDNE
jgi:regulator of sigma E protease